jgi:transcriptional regulator with XRE-family HTH domain
MQGKRTSRPPISAEHVVLGGALRELRARRAITQEELGFRSGQHRNYVGALERGEVNPTFRTLMKISAGLDVPLSALLRLYERRRGQDAA